MDLDTFWDNPEAWLEAWQTYRDRRKTLTPAKEAGAKFWGQLASRRPSAGHSQDRLDRARRALSFIERHLPLRPGMRVLDVGAGSGVLSLPLARKGLEVTALDLSDDAMANLRERAARESLPIETRCGDWEQLDLDHLGWTRAFDLVIASMTPAVSTPATFLMLEQASRGAVFYAAFTRPMNLHFQKELWRPILGSDLPAANHGSFFLFNWLYSRGIPAQFEHYRTPVEETADLESITDHILHYYAMFKELTQEDRERITTFLAGISQGGQVTRRGEMNVASLLWMAPQPPSAQ